MMNNVHDDIEYTTLPAIPALAKEYRKVAVDRVPGVGKKRSGKSDPTRGFAVVGVRVDSDNLAAYNQAVGFRTSNQLPLTYPFVLGFPLVIHTMSQPDFPFAAMGAVHISNSIEQRRAIGVDEEFSLLVHATNLRAHRKGLLIDLVTEVVIDDEPVWIQTSTFLGLGARLDAKADTSVVDRGEQRGINLGEAVLPKKVAQTAQWKVTRADIDAYAAASGDRNPVHTSTLGAKAFGFPGVIAHGMYTAAKMLTLLEGRVDGHVRHTVDFARPVVVPAKISCWAIRSEDGSWDLQVRKTKDSEKVHAHATVEQL